MPQMPEWIRPAAWGAVGGALAITIIGFSAEWVTTTGSAAAMAEDEAEQAVLLALTPVCVAQFRAETAQVRETQLAALEEESSWNQGDIVAEEGWATMPGAEEPNADLAEACAERLLEPAEAA